MTDSAGPLTTFLGALATVDRLARSKAADLTNRRGVVSVVRDWQFSEVDGGRHEIDLYLEIEVAEGHLTWGLWLRRDPTTSGWILERGLTRNVTRHQEEVYAFPSERLDDASSLARRVPDAVAELFAREHEPA